MFDSPLTRDFFDAPVIDVARRLLGRCLVRQIRRRRLVGRIVEVEAYLAHDDPACHASRGATRKNASMFGPPGHAYVYPIHAKHCFNIVTEPEQIASAVLIRAIEPLDGIEWMQRQRGGAIGRDISSGPARLCQAMAIDRTLDGWDLTRGEKLWVSADGADSLPDEQIGRSARIGVTSAHDLELRYYERGNLFVSGPKRLRT